ncbi:lysine histidine transporter 1-like [Rhododendron vialii]|uniref:lysine histidine transporter 1-like n=1 Tax=Rhododendron vialii TaxID=182163 RepID=UPI00265F4619|nr:lysine histidine transporter 1-like [Rhododendron vialii]
MTLENDQSLKDERAAIRLEELNEWLPVTSSRKANWWYSAFHNVTAMVGAGVLGLPYAMSQLGWGPGVTVIVLSWIITLYTLWQMVEMHEMVPGKRLDRYHELGQHVFGEKLGLWIVVPQQLMVQVGSDIVYMVTGGKCLKKFADTVWPNNPPIKTTYFIMIFGAVQLVLSNCPSLNSIAFVSLVAAVMSLSYSTIAWVTSLHKGVQPDVKYTLRASTTAGSVFDFLSALGEVAFAFAGHSVVLEIQATIPSTPENPSKKPMWKGVVVAYIIVALCYFPVSMIGFWVFGNSVDDNVLLSLEKPAWLVATANMFVVFHVIGSYQVFAQPVFDMIQAFLVLKMNFKPTGLLRFVARISYVALSMFIGMTFPFFGGLLAFFGGFAFAPTSYFLPCIMWLIIYKPKRFSLSWFTNWICIILGVLLMILAPIGALRGLILQAKDFQYYS